MRALDYWLLSGLTVSLVACGASTSADIVGSGVLSTETRAATGFERVSARGFVDVRIAVDGDFDVKLTCDENLHPYILTEVVGDELRVRTQDGVSLSTSQTCEAAVVMPRLVGADTSGSGNLHVTSSSPLDALTSLSSSGSGTIDVTVAIQSGLDVSLTGSGAGRLSQAEGDRITASVSGSGGLRVEAGTTDDLQIDVSGSGAVEARGLTARQAGLRTTGSGGIEATVTEKVEATVSGSGNISVYGNPADRDVTKTGSGEVDFPGS